MADIKSATMHVTSDITACLDARDFLLERMERLKHNEALLDKYNDLLEHDQLFICLTGEKLNFRFEPSYPLLEIMAELGR